ncbi:MAG: putative amidase [Mycobacterium sp.]|jgi:predicted TIM-barrel fold metal-dependent hydrolase|nr:putative amidase [Mycobacterium sp.]
MLDLEQLRSINLTAGAGDGPRTVTFLPEPEKRHREYTVISVDDHVVEPAHLFKGRMPKRFIDRAPFVLERADGRQVWQWEGTEPNLGLNAVVGRPVLEASFEPQRFDEMRRGAWDIHSRVADMDINGIYASLNFPSALPGFAGQRLQLTTKDRDLAHAVVNAWNDWHLEEWAGSYPDRIIPIQLPWLLDPEEAAQDIRRNAERGFKAVAFTEAPHKLGLPSLHTGYWDPFLEACAETETVVCLHIGSGQSALSTAPDAPPDTVGVLFFGSALLAAVDWLYSRVPVRFPDIKICLSEGGVGWVPCLLDRLDHVGRYQQLYGTWQGIDLMPADVLQRNFYFCALEDPSTLALRHRIGIDHIMLESDYPHLDSTWPNTQAVVAESLAGMPQEDVTKMTWQNASRLFRHPVPESVQRDPNSF